MSFQYKGREIRGIDIHTHVPHPGGPKSDPRSDQKERYFRNTLIGMTIEEMADLYRQLEMIAIVFDVDMETTTNDPFVGNDYMAKVMERFPDVFICWASVDPHKGR